jgi:hypothetical protein
MTRSLEDLMNEDPLQLSDADLGILIGALRQHRQMFLSDERAGIKPRAAPKAKSNLTLDQLLAG